MSLVRDTVRAWCEENQGDFEAGTVQESALEAIRAVMDRCEWLMDSEEPLMRAAAVLLEIDLSRILGIS